MKKAVALESGLSIIIPTYNGASWLPKTIPKVLEAVKNAKLEQVELLVINDGSTDNTAKIVEDIAKKTKSIKIRLVNQANGGRFLARDTGCREAKYGLLLYVDTRVFIGKNSLLYVLNEYKKDPSREVWCSHVIADTKGNIYAKFWEAIAFVAWRKYFRNPRSISYGIEEFDQYPKGTTCFFIKKQIMQDANRWFVKNTKDVKTSNDDTLLIRYIAKEHSINVGPEFNCLYHARTSLGQYVKHVLHRGKVFVDGFLRRDGNIFYWPLVLFLVLSPLSILVLLLMHEYIVYFLVAFLFFWVAELILTLMIRVPFDQAVSLFILSPVFGLYYGLGIWSAFIKIHILRKGEQYGQ